MEGEATEATAKELSHLLRRVEAEEHNEKEAVHGFLQDLHPYLDPILRSSADRLIIAVKNRFAEEQKRVLEEVSSAHQAETRQLQEELGHRQEVQANLQIDLAKTKALVAKTKAQVVQGRISRGKIRNAFKTWRSNNQAREQAKALIDRVNRKRALEKAFLNWRKRAQAINEQSAKALREKRLEEVTIIIIKRYEVELSKIRQILVKRTEELDAERRRRTHVEEAYLRAVSHLNLEALTVVGRSPTRGERAGGGAAENLMRLNQLHSPEEEPRPPLYTNGNGHTNNQDIGFR